MTKTRTKKPVGCVGPIYTSPDGGETVYVEEHGVKTLVSESQKAKSDKQEREEQYLNDAQAIRIRQRYPALQEAWDNYKTLWHLTVTDDDYDGWYY